MTQITLTLPGCQNPIKFNSRSTEGLFDKFNKPIARATFEQIMLPKLKQLYNKIIIEAKKYFSELKVLNKGVWLSKEFKLKIYDRNIDVILLEYENWDICKALGFIKNEKFTEEAEENYETFDNAAYEVCLEPFEKQLKLYFKPFTDIFKIGADGDRDNGIYYISVKSKVSL
jgi:hypothetical protein